MRIAKKIVLSIELFKIIFRVRVGRNLCLWRSWKESADDKRSERVRRKKNKNLKKTSVEKETEGKKLHWEKRSACTNKYKRNNSDYGNRISDSCN